MIFRVLFPLIAFATFASARDECFDQLMNDFRNGVIEATEYDFKFFDAVDTAIKGSEPTEEDIIERIIIFLDKYAQYQRTDDIEYYWKDKEDYKEEYERLCRMSLMHVAGGYAETLNQPKYCGGFVALSFDDPELIQDYGEYAVRFAKKVRSTVIVGNYPKRDICAKTAKLYVQRKSKSKL